MKSVAKVKNKGWWLHYKKMLSLVKLKGTGNHKNILLHAIEAFQMSSFIVPAPSSTSHVALLLSSSIPTSSDFLPPSVLSLYITSSSASSLNPSSSVLAHRGNKHNDNGDDVSMVSAPSSSKLAASMISGASTHSCNEEQCRKLNKWVNFEMISMHFNKYSILTWNSSIQ